MTIGAPRGILILTLGRGEPEIHNEKRGLVLLFPLVFILITGCAAQLASLGLNPAYFTNPNSPGFTQPAYYGLCEQCGKAFMFSQAQWNAGQSISCPNDGHIQDIQAASQRYQQVQQQQQQAQANDVMKGLLFGAFMNQTASQHANNPFIQNYMKCVNDCTVMLTASGYSLTQSQAECTNRCPAN